jgi:MFS family permease
MSLGSKFFPPKIRPTAMGFLFVIAQLGGSLFPIVTGVIAANSGVSVMQPILVALLGAMTLSWFFVPNPKASGNEALHQE